MDESQINLEVRLAALEYTLIQGLKAAFILSAGADAPMMAKKLREGATESLSQKTWPDVQPALSDHFSDELHMQVDRLLSGVEEILVETFRGKVP